MPSCSLKCKKKKKRKGNINPEVSKNYKKNNAIFFFKVQKKKKKNINPEVSKTYNGETMVSKFAICGGKKSRFVKKQEARGVLSSLGLKAPLNKIPLLDFFF